MWSIKLNSITFNRTQYVVMSYKCKNEVCFKGECHSINMFLAYPGGVLHVWDHFGLKLATRAVWVYFLKLTEKQICFRMQLQCGRTPAQNNLLNQDLCCCTTSRTSRMKSLRSNFWDWNLKALVGLFGLKLFKEFLWSCSIYLNRFLPSLTPDSLRRAPPYLFYAVQSHIPLLQLTVWKFLVRHMWILLYIGKCDGDFLDIDVTKAHFNFFRLW